MLICGHPNDLPYFDGNHPLIRWFDFLSVGLHYYNEAIKLFRLHFDVNVNAGRHLESG